MMNKIAALAIVAILSGVTHARAEKPNVVTSINPIHSLAAGVMKGIGTPYLIIKGAGSPHTYSLKPSDASALSKANVVFWVGPRIEGFLERPLSTLGKNATKVELMDTEGLTLLPYRESGTWESHDHGDHHDGEEHKDHGKHEKDHDDHHKDEGHAHHDEHDHKEEGHAHHAEDDDHNKDAHIWLAPKNAKLIVSEIAKTLKQADPENAGKYDANKNEMIRKLDELNEDLQKKLASVKDRPYIVFHDSFQYLDEAFGLRGVGSVTVSPDKQPGAQRISKIREKITELGAVCIFSEPQFAPKIVKAIAKNTKAKTGVLDPLGADLTIGPELYFKLMQQNVSSLTACLSENS